jgi:hypothetical protein
MADLNDIMEFDHVIEVLPDGGIIHRSDIYAPSLYDGDLDSDTWELLDGYTGQQGGGSIMHNSEFIGGRMERDIRENPGVYVALVCTWLDTEEDDDDNVEGWAVARLRDPHE